MVTDKISFNNPHYNSPFESSTGHAVDGPAIMIDGTHITLRDVDSVLIMNALIHTSRPDQMPALRRFINQVNGETHRLGIHPASTNHHNNYCGGLEAHSNNVAFAYAGLLSGAPENPGLFTRDSQVIIVVNEKPLTSIASLLGADQISGLAKLHKLAAAYSAENGDGGAPFSPMEEKWIAASYNPKRLSKYQIELAALPTEGTSYQEKFRSLTALRQEISGSQAEQTDTVSLQKALRAFYSIDFVGMALANPANNQHSTRQKIKELTEIAAGDLVKSDNGLAQYHGLFTQMAVYELSIAYTTPKKPIAAIHDAIREAVGNMISFQEASDLIAEHNIPRALFGELVADIRMKKGLTESEKKLYSSVKEAGLITDAILRIDAKVTPEAYDSAMVSLLGQGIIEKRAISTAKASLSPLERLLAGWSHDLCKTQRHDGQTIIPHYVHVGGAIKPFDVNTDYAYEGNVAGIDFVDGKAYRHNKPVNRTELKDYLKHGSLSADMFRAAIAPADEAGLLAGPEQIDKICTAIQDHMGLFGYEIKRLPYPGKVLVRDRMLNTNPDLSLLFIADFTATVGMEKELENILKAGNQTGLMEYYQRLPGFADVLPLLHEISAGEGGLSIDDIFNKVRAVSG